MSEILSHAHVQQTAHAMIRREVDVVAGMRLLLWYAYKRLNVYSDCLVLYADATSRSDKNPLYWTRRRFSKERELQCYGAPQEILAREFKPALKKRGRKKKQ